MVEIRALFEGHELEPATVGRAVRSLSRVCGALVVSAQVDNYALDLNKGEEKVQVTCLGEAPPVALAFKLEEGKFGQLTYMRSVRPHSLGRRTGEALL